MDIERRQSKAYLVSLWVGRSDSARPVWRGALVTAAEQRLYFSTLAELNRWLSLSRARRVASYLQARGVAPVRIDIQAFGATQPVATEHTPTAWARNRRVEIEIQ